MRREPRAVPEVRLEVRTGVELDVVHVHELAVHNLRPRLDQLARARRHLAEEVVPVVVPHDAHLRKDCSVNNLDYTTLYYTTLHYTILQYILHAIYYILYAIYYILYTIYYIPYTIYYIL